MASLPATVNMDHVLRLTATTVGRDKIYRTVQYWSRFLAWYLTRRGYSAQAIAVVNALKTHFGTVRRAMRLGKNLEHVHAASTLSKAMQSEAAGPASRDAQILNALAIGRQLGYAGYLTLDIGVWANSLRLVQLKNAKAVADDAYRFWASGLAFSIASGVFKLLQYQRAARIVSNTPEEKLRTTYTAKEKNTTVTQLVMDIADICIPLTALGILNANEGVVGIAGTVSSLLGLRNQWRKV